MSTKEQFLNRIAHRLGRAQVLEKVELPLWSYVPQQTVLKETTTDDLVKVLQTQCLNQHISFRRTNRSQLTAVIDEILNDLQATSIIVTQDKRNETYHLQSYYEELRQRLAVHFWTRGEGATNMQFAEKATVGVTFSDLTLAESATIMLQMSEPHGRSISLLPYAHIAIIPQHSIVPRMTQAAQKIRQQWQQDNEIPSCISFISGPSKSADIEMKLIVGVHGPVELFYIVVDDL